MNIGMRPDAGKQGLISAFQQFIQKGVAVSKVIDETPRFGSCAQGQAAYGKTAESGFAGDHGSRIEQMLSGGSPFGHMEGMIKPCVPLMIWKGKDLLRLLL